MLCFLTAVPSHWPRWWSLGSKLPRDLCSSLVGVLPELYFLTCSSCLTVLVQMHLGLKTVPPPSYWSFKGISNNKSLGCLTLSLYLSHGGPERRDSNERLFSLTLSMEVEIEMWIGKYSKKNFNLLYNEGISFESHNVWM